MLKHFGKNFAKILSMASLKAEICTGVSARVKFRITDC